MSNLEASESISPGIGLEKSIPTFSEETVPYSNELATVEARPKGKKRDRDYSDFDPTKFPTDDLPHLEKKKRRRTTKKTEKHTNSVPVCSNKSDEGSASADGEDLCCICFDAPKVRGKINSCDHKYCYDCIKRWADETNTCPQCKKRFTKLERIPPVNGEDTNTNQRRSRRKKDVITIKKKDIKASGDQHLSGVLARVFEHFALRPVNAADRPRNSAARGGLHRLFRLERRANLPPTSVDAPISLMDSDDESSGGSGANAPGRSNSNAVRSEVDTFDDLVTDLPSLIQRI